ncbi:MAG: HEPN domain-containing protein [Betaproteobacteria bacterium]
MGKASRAALSARLLLDAGDVNGACNRAYYAMFDAARAALIESGAPVQSEVGRTHSGLISAFSLHLVKTAQVPIEYGKALNKVAEIRLIADYTEDEVTAETAKWAVEQAVEFIAAMQKAFAPLGMNEGPRSGPKAV